MSRNNFYLTRIEFLSSDNDKIIKDRLIKLNKLNEKRKKFGNIYQQITIFFSSSTFIYYKAVSGYVSSIVR